MSGPPHRTVLILKDQSAPLWYMRCVAPCDSRDEWCMRGPEGKHPPHCYLGGSLSEADTRRMAARCGYTVQDEQPEGP